MSPSDLPATLLAFGAHPDDIEFGCGGVIARETQSGRPAHFVICSRGESGTNGTPAERTAEAQKSAALLGATCEFLNLGGDAHLTHTVAHALQLAAIIRRLRPQIVLAPTLVENQHPDHVIVGRLVRDAARLARYGGVAELRETPAHAIASLLFYAITPDAEPADRSALLIDISSAVPAWTAAMEAHTTQLRTRNYVELQLTRARVNGLRSGVAHATALFPNDPLVFDSLAQLARTARQF
ncbi:PIG-L family deacetylase [Nibricoccus aquaticus]|nr:PIG-L family deacetylase [Nibricoccus aquaticus]